MSAPSVVERIQAAPADFVAALEALAQKWETAAQQALAADHHGNAAVLRACAANVRALLASWRTT